MKQEIWKPVVGYEGLYEVSNLGRVKSLYDGRRKVFRLKFLKLLQNKGGYLYVSLSRDGKEKYKLIHRLVAESFIPNPNKFPIINHKDECKTNNSVGNLEWCSYKYNCNYGTRNERMAKAKTNGKTSKTVLQFDLNGEFIKEYPSTIEVKRRLGFSQANICACCNGKIKTSHGFVWKYKTI